MEVWSGAAPGSHWYKTRRAARSILWSTWKTSPSASGPKKRCARAKIASAIMADSCPTMLWVTDAGRWNPVRQPDATGNSTGSSSRTSGRRQVAPAGSPRRCAGVCRSLRARGAGALVFPGRSAHPPGRWRVAFDRLLRGAALIAGRRVPGTRRPQRRHHRAQASRAGPAGERREVPPAGGKHS